MTNDNLFLRAPFSTRNEIPIFSNEDDYVFNYENIASDHLVSLEKTGLNPFMDEGHINEINSETVNFINGLSHRAQSVLDVGVGLGGLISQLDIPKKFGVDIALDYLQHAKSLGISVAMSKIEELPYKNEQFDLVTCTDVLEHVLDFLLCSFQIGRVVKPGGLIVIRVPYKENLDVYRETNQYDFVHVRNFDLSRLRLVFEGLFGYEYLEHKFLGTSYRGWKTSVFEDIIINKEHAAGWAEACNLSNFPRVGELLNTDHFAIEDVMNDISMNAPELMQKATQMLNRPVEICVAFRAPEDRRTFHKAPLWGCYSNRIEEVASASRGSPLPDNNADIMQRVIHLTRKLERMNTEVQNIDRSLKNIMYQQEILTSQLNEFFDKSKPTRPLALNLVRSIRHLLTGVLNFFK